jgi:predicted permease
VVQALHAGGRALTDRVTPRLRHGLVVVQIALALILLSAGGLFLRGLSRFEARDSGWKVDRVLTAGVLLPAARYAPRDVRASFADRLRARLAAIPGAAHVAVAWLPPVSLFALQRHVTVEGASAAPGLGPVLATNGVSPDYFDALGMRLREGRLFTDADEMESTVIVNESAARDLWPGQSAVGKRVADADRPDRWRTVVGVVSDVGFPATLKEVETRYQSYLPIRQVPMSFTIVVRAREHLSPQALAGEVRRAVADVDPALPVLDPMSVRAQVSRSLSNFSLMGWVLSGLAAMGLFLSALAVYGLFSRFVAERTREIGVRMALGAHTAEVLRLVLGKGLRLAAVGAMIGAGGALMVARLLRSAVTGLPVHDPLAVPALVLALVAVALLACWLPARRAAALDPMDALRHE